MARRAHPARLLAGAICAALPLALNDPAHASAALFLLIQQPKPQSAPVAAAPPQRAEAPPAVAVAPATPAEPVAPVPLARPPDPPPPLRLAAIYPRAELGKATFSDLPHWAGDDHRAAFATFLTSCERFDRRADLPATAPQTAQALRDICLYARDTTVPDRAAARAFFETHFRPYRIRAPGEADGFLTAYYEPEVAASRTRSELFAHPFHGKPDDLVSGRPEGAGFDARATAGRLENGRLIPYYDRAEIEAGALQGKAVELAYVADPTDILFTQIQGSARLILTDGSVMRVGYAAHNGHRYTPVGRVMVERGIASREQMSMDFIRIWMKENPQGARDIRHANRSYVFFRVLDTLRPQDGPIGAQGVPVTPWRSLAVDRNVHTYGTPIYIAGQMPTGEMQTLEPFHRLMIAQDTGSAIVGPARGDLYLGSGRDMGMVAGRVRHRADWFILVPAALAALDDQLAAGEKRATARRSR